MRFVSTILISSLTLASAFTRPSVSTRFSTAVGPVVPNVKELEPPNPLSYSEQSRKYRRDFYTHDSWLKARQKNRFVGTLTKITESGVVRQLVDEILLVGAIATSIVLWNALFVTGYEDFAMVHHDPLITGVPLLKLPGEPFTLSSPALALLLVFKTNTSYARWDEARKAWGVVVNNSRSVAREVSAWTLKADISDAEKKMLITRVTDCVWLFPRSLQRHLWSPAEDTEPFAQAVRERLDPKLAEEMINARHKPTRALYEMSKAVNELPLDTIQRSTIDKCISSMCDALGACDRIFGSPVPSIYTRHAARFLELWMFFLPLALYKPFEYSWNHWAMIPASAIIGFFLLGIEELAIQLEEPFSVLPLDKIAGGIGLSASEHAQWATEQMEEDKTAQRNRVLYRSVHPFVILSASLHLRRQLQQREQEDIQSAATLPAYESSIVVEDQPKDVTSSGTVVEQTPDDPINVVSSGSIEQTLDDPVDLTPSDPFEQMPDDNQTHNSTNVASSDSTKVETNNPIEVTSSNSEDTTPKDFIEKDQIDSVEVTTSDSIEKAHSDSVEATTNDAIEKAHSDSVKVATSGTIEISANDAIVVASSDSHEHVDSIKAVNGNSTAAFLNSSDSVTSSNSTVATTN